MSTGPTTLEQELLLAAWNSELLAELGVGKPGADTKHRADAARLRQRAAWVRELVEMWSANGRDNETSRFARDLIGRLAGPIPATEPDGAPPRESR